MIKNKKTILCCDDDEGILDLLSLIITDLGHEVVQVREGTKIIQIIEEIKPSLIFLDLWMPKVNGEVIGKDIKNNIRTQHIPLVIVSAHREIKQKAVNIGAEEYIYKPFDIEEIEGLIRKYV